MPVVLQNKTFIDEWGNVTTFDHSNAGDRVRMRLDFLSNIYLTSGTNPFILDPVTYTITSGGASWESEGFRVGDTVEVRIVNQSGVFINGWSATATYVSGQYMKLNTIPYWYSTTNQEIIYFVVVGRNRQGLEVFFNYVENSLPNTASNDFSLIDGEATRFKFDNIDSMPVSSDQNAIIAGNQSGQYLKSAKLTRLANPALSDTRYILEIEYVNSGIYNQEWFDSSECLKPIVRTMWSSIQGEPYQQTPLLFNYNSNTGWFNEGHNSDPIDSSILQGVTEIDYALPTTFDIIVDGSPTELGIGASYVPLADAYYKNKPLQQGRYGMIVPTSNLVVGSYVSETNDTGSGYTIQVNNIATFGVTTTIINVTITPNTQFASMFGALEDGDRTFYLWVKVGNVNWLAFAGQLTTDPPIGGELEVVSEVAFYDHSDNDISVPAFSPVNEFDTEDDLAYLASFIVENGSELSSMAVRIKAKNTVSLNEFTLQQTVYGLSSEQVTAGGVTLVDQSISINPQLPTTSNKRDSFLERDSSIDNPGVSYGLKIYYPFILRWEYWLQQLNANVFFYPNQNKNWQNYSENGNWSLFLELELVKNGLAYVKEIKVIDLIYNNEKSIESTIEFFRLSDMSPISVILDEPCLMRSTHTNLMGSWSSNVWGMHTNEPYESAPRWISSTAIDYDGNTNNPLEPVTGNRSTLLLTGNVAVIETIIDGTKLPGSDYSFTAKIKDPSNPLPPYFKTTAPDDDNKETAPFDDNNKTLA